MSVVVRAFLWVALVLACSTAPLAAQTPRAYRADDLGSFGGPGLVGIAINANGEIAGHGYRTDGTIRAFRWTESGGLEDLGANGGWLSQAIAINDNGDVAGVYLDQFNNPHGFIAPRGGVMRDLRTPERQIVSVNSITNDGRIAGQMFSLVPSFQVHAFRTLSDGTLQDLGDGTRASVAWRMNDDGQVTGYEAVDATGNSQSAFRFSDEEGMVDLGTLGGPRSTGLAINNSGVIVGWSEGSNGIWSRAFRAKPGAVMEDLGTLGGPYAGAESINDSGSVVGWSAGYYFHTAFVYTDADGMIDLNTRVAPSESPGVMHDAVAINNSGQIVVLYHGAEGTRTVRLTPVVDTQAPLIAGAAASPNVLQPPDGRLVPVVVSASATDDTDGSPVCAIMNVMNSEAASGVPDPDVQLTGPLSVSLRASRLGTGEGRSYTVKIRCSDFSGNEATTDVVVLVPHDSR
jgi:probable HAF family extracellular repeat protein